LVDELDEGVGFRSSFFGMMDFRKGFSHESRAFCGEEGDLVQIRRPKPILAAVELIGVDRSRFFISDPRFGPIYLQVEGLLRHCASLPLGGGVVAAAAAHEDGSSFLL
jgi:hypothetical protein